MDRTTQLALNALNRQFYAAIAPEWSASRKHPWPGFERVLAHAPTSEPLRVLDVGCGDGRFGDYLAARRKALVYVGCDASEALLAHARARALGGQVRFELRDVLHDPLPSGPFELVCLLGVLHHVPGFDQRAALLRSLASEVTPGGLLALTVWRLPDDPRFPSRVVPFADYNRAASDPIALDQLEPGDTLLRWGGGGAPPRYCHFPDDAELTALLAATPLRISERFRADGRGDQLNEYILLRP
ncbi:MAG: methyltransferase domain-containing protein [Polyangiales bacterium]